MSSSRSGSSRAAAGVARGADEVPPVAVKGPAGADPLVPAAGDAGAAPGPARSGSAPRGAGSSRRSGRPAAAPAAPAVSAPEPEPGAAGYLNLPGPEDSLWASVPLQLRQNLAMPAYQLVNPARGHLATPAGRKLKSALGAAVRGKITGTHWLALLTAPRTAFGGPASARAEQAYKALEQLVTDFLRPALGTVAGAEFAAGVELAAPAPAAPETDATAVPAPAAAVPGPAPEAVTLPAPAGPPRDSAAPAQPGPAAGTPAPAPVPVGDLAELLRVTTQTPGTILAVTSAHTTTAQTALAQAQDLEPAHLPTVQVSGHDRSSLIRALYTRLGLGQRRRLPGLDEAEDLITAELQHTPRLVITTTTLGLSPSALQLLHRLWEPKPFPLVLVGHSTLDGLLKRHDLAELHPHITHHRVQEPAATPAPAADPDLASDTAPAASDTAPAASASGDNLAAPHPAPVVPTPALDPPPSGPLPPAPDLVLAPSPQTLHQARSTLPQMIRAAGEGTSTPLARGTHHALLTAPTTATALGWDLTTATAHGTADARKKLGDLIALAAAGTPQVLRRHVTPLAVLLPAAPDGTPLPPATHPDQPTPGTPGVAATTAPSNRVVTPTPGAVPAAAAPTAPDHSSEAEPDDTLFSTPAAPAGQPAPAPATAEPDQSAPADTEPATSSAPAPAAGKPALQDPTAAAPSAGHPATTPPTPPTPPAAPATPRRPRRLAPLADALTTVLTPQAPDHDTNTPAGPRALSTGIRTLDDALGGLQPGRFYLAAAAPGTGASLLATTTARTTALDHHLPVLYAASGLTHADVAARIVAAHLPVDYRRLRTGRLTPTEQADATTLHTELAAARLYIDDGTDLTPEAIAETAADLAHTTTTQPAQPGLALVVVDRLQALDDPRLPLSGPRLTDAAQALAHLARTHHVPVLAILDTDHPDLITTLGLDTTLTLHPHPDAPTTQLLITIAERDLGTQATLTLTADRTHARLTDPTPHDPYTHPRPAPEAPNTPAPTAPAPEAPTQASARPTIAVPGHPAQDTAAAPQPDPDPDPDPDPEVTPGTAAALDALTPDQPPAHPLRPTRDRAARTAAPRPARPGGGDYAGRDYSHFLNMINSVVEQTLQEHSGDTEAAITALELKAIPNGMALFEATRVGGNYEHTVYPERLEFLSKKSRDGADDVWEGRHKWENGPLMDQLKAGTHQDIDVDVLDTNAAFCSSLKTWLPIGALQHQPDGGFNPKRSGIYLLPKRPTWEHPHLPDPIGNRREPGPVLLDDATIRLLIRCHKLGLAEAPHITQAWTSGASENIAEKFRRVLTTAREKAIIDGDDVTEKYVKAIYSKFVSTIGESTYNRDLRRPDWMHIIRSQAFANLWYKAHRAHEHGLTIVRLRGTDELHITGDTAWRTVFTEGRLTTQLKLKKQYTLYAKAT
ncbi:DnaB-like helicase C-terminal domain-containing protein [Kitasatospora sp. NPDC006786]|uniref:DnaB-like helicase C-terminal domain-containing protein n=1 Tax=unclassified Kitasatospora TaxID=2633591 RepID=UPI0033BFE73B